MFLGTASCFPTPTRGVSCIALQHDDGSVWLFDCGEGSQIQLQKSRIKPGKINKIFITHLHGDHVFGLPGLLCTLGNGGDTEGDYKAVDIYGPLGIRKLIATNLELSRSPLPYKYSVHEIVPAACQYPDDWAAWPVNLEWDGLAGLEGEARRIERDEESGEWPLFDEGNFRVTAGPIMHRIPSFAFVITGKDQPGTIDAKKLKDEFDLPPGPLYAKLKRGESVVTAAGRSITPKEVLGPPKKGKKVVILGDTNDTSLIEEMSRDCDLLVHEATMENALREKAVEYGHSTPAMAAEFAHKVSAAKLCLTHVSPRYKPFQSGRDATKESEAADEGKGRSAKILLDEARQRLGELGATCSVFIAEDFYELEV